MLYLVFIDLRQGKTSSLKGFLWGPKLVMETEPFQSYLKFLHLDPIMFKPFIVWSVFFIASRVVRRGSKNEAWDHLTPAAAVSVYLADPVYYINMSIFSVVINEAIIVTK